MGSGKLEEITAYIKADGIEMAVFDDELSAAQIRNLERVLECKVLDRTNLILDIFDNINFASDTNNILYFGNFFFSQFTILLM